MRGSPVPSVDSRRVNERVTRREGRLSEETEQVDEADKGKGVPAGESERPAGRESDGDRSVEADLAVMVTTLGLC